MFCFHHLNILLHKLKCKCKDGACDGLRLIFELQGKILLQTAVNALIQKRNALALQKRMIDDLWSSDQGQCLPPSVNSRRLTEAVLTLQSPCQARHYIISTKTFGLKLKYKCKDSAYDVLHLISELTGMTDKVVRQRMGRESVAHNIARRERAAEATIPRRGRSKGKNVVGSSSEAQHEPAYEPRHHNHDEDEDATEIAPEVECEGATDIEVEMQDDVEDEVEDVIPPPPPQPR
ncbi:hypothetical protein QL285_019430 [Trifolium repens]|nr:hypothetical protein QL285_019430 [Trifolium repens]